MSTSGIVKRFRQAEIPVRAAALAYHTLLGVVPIVGLLFSYLKAVGVTKRWVDLVRNFLLEHLNVSSSQVFIQQFDKLTGAAQSRTSSLIGLAVLLYTSYNLITKLANSLDIIFYTALTEARMEAKFIKLMLKRAIVIAGLPLAITFSVALTSWVQRDSWLRPLFKLQSVGPYLALPLPLIIDILSLTMVYRLIPKHPGSWKESLKAASLVGPVFAAARMAMGLYNKHALLTLKFYGALAAIPIFIIWVQFAWMIVLSGALLIRKKVSKPNREDRPIAEAAPSQQSPVASHL